MLKAERNGDEAQSWRSSGQAKLLLKISSCELMHLRDAGRIRLVKKGNAFLYHLGDISHLAETASLAKNQRSAKRTSPAPPSDHS